MTDFELQVWAAAYGSSMANFNLEPRTQAGDSFELATYAVQQLRRTKIEPVFGEQCGAPSEIEEAVHSRLKDG